MSGAIEVYREAALRQWLIAGEAAGFCSRVVCDMHEGIPYTDAEYGAMEEGDHPCVFAVRIHVGEPHYWGCDHNG